MAVVFVGGEVCGENDVGDVEWDNWHLVSYVLMILATTRYFCWMDTAVPEPALPVLAADAAPVLAVPEYPVVPETS